MKKKTYNHLQIMLFSNKTIFFIEFCFFYFVIIAIVIPSILNNRILVIPTKLELNAFFFFRVFIFATFEELIYRVYLPFQMDRFYFLINRCNVQLKKLNPFILVSNVLFAFAHSYLGVYNIIFAFIVGIGFSLIYKYVKEKVNIYSAIFTISLIHFFYNSIAFYILVYFDK